MNGNATRAANNNNKHAVESGMNAGGTAGSNANNTSTNVVALDLTNTDDFVGGLSQACINPLFTSSDSNKKEAEPKQTNGSNGNVIIVPRSRRSRRRRQRQAAKVEEEVLTAAAAEKEPTTTATTATADDDTATTKTAAVASPASTKTSDKEDKNDIVKATIADCLACSGCVTTAETVLLEQNNNSELFLKQINGGLGDVPNNNNKKTTAVILTISPSSLADLQRHLFGGRNGGASANAATNGGNGSSGSSSKQLLSLLLIQYWYLHLNIQYVIDGNVPLWESRQQAAIEFVTAYKHNQQQQQKEKELMMDQDEEVVDEEEELYERQLIPSVALSSSQTQYYFVENGKSKIITHNGQSQSLRKGQSLPLLSSSCPAMVCYVETSMHQHVPHLSKVVSSMTYSSSSSSSMLTKSASASTSISQTNTAADASDDMHDEEEDSSHQFFHLAVMPCHDKKLESSRRDFSSTPDMVLTTTEFLDVMEQVCPMSLNEYLWQQLRQSQQSHSNDAVRIVRPKNGLDEVSDIIMQQDRDKVEQMIVDDDEDEMMMMNGNGSKTTSSTVVLRPTWFTTIEEEDDDYSDSNDNNNDDKSSSPFVYGSGGYADYIFRYALRHLFGIDYLDPHWIRGVSPSHAKHGSRSSARRRKQQQESTNYYETCLLQNTTTGQYFVPTTSDDDGNFHKDEKETVKTLLRFGIAYGLQTVQTVLKNTNSNTSEGEREENASFDYLEVMACPSSCLNGNGQIKKVHVQQQQQQQKISSSSLQLETPRESRQRISETQRYFTTVNSFESNKEDRRDDDFTDKPPITTRYHVVPPMQHTMGAAAGVAVQDTQW